MKIKAKTNIAAATIIVTAIMIVTYLMTYGVHATTISSQSGYVDVDENGEYYYVSPFEYGEIKDGLFVRTFHEEIESIEFLRCDEYIDLYNIEYRKIEQARMLDEMTPEMIADGGYYQNRSGGFITMQADIDYSRAKAEGKGEAGEGSIVIDFDESTDPYGYVTIIAEVDPAIEETGTTCFIRLENLDTGEWTEIAELLPVNHYTKTAWKLPVGTYRVAEGGIYEDYANKYPLVNLTGEFVLQDGGSAQVRVTIGDVSGEVETTTAETTVAETETEPETIPVETLPEIEETEEAVEEESGISAAVVIAVVIVIVLIAVIVIVIMRSRRSNWK